MIYINDKGEYAKLIELKDGVVTISINDKSKTMAWHDFIKEFRSIGNERK